MKRVALTVEKRDVGKGVSRRMRVSGRIPAILYGRSVEPLAISVDEKQLEEVVKGEAGMNVLVDLSVAGGDSGLALMRDYQADPFKRNFTHVDFQAVTMKDKLDIEVPIEIIGKSIGVKEGGVLELLRRTVHVRALPDKIPSSIRIDISELAIGDSVHADELTLPEGAEYPHDANYTVVAVVPPAKVEEVTPAAVEMAEGVEGAEAVTEGAEGKEGAEAAEDKQGKEGAAPAEGKKKE